MAGKVDYTMFPQPEGCPLQQSTYTTKDRGLVSPSINYGLTQLVYILHCEDGSGLLTNRAPCFVL